MANGDTSSRMAQEALLRALTRTADARRRQGRQSDAERLYQRALGLAEEVFGPGHLEVATILNNLAALQDAQGKIREAEPLYRRALAMKKELLGADHPDTAMTFNNLAVLLRRMGSHTEPR